MALFGLVSTSAMLASSAFIIPLPPLMPRCNSPLLILPTSNPASHMPTVSPRSRCRVRIKSESRCAPCLTSLESAQSPYIFSEENLEVQDQISLGNLPLNNRTESVDPALRPMNTTFNVSASKKEEFFLLETTNENNTDFFSFGESVESTARLSYSDGIGYRNIKYPSIAVSYDELGMVQADVDCYTNQLEPAVVMGKDINKHGIDAVERNDVMVSVFASNPDTIAGKDEDYPLLVKLLFQKDIKGQTLASKLFNLTLLIVSFGYVFSLVINIDHGMTRGWTPAEIGMRIPLDTWASYENSLSEKPVATKTIINIVIYLLGDWLSQTLFQKKNVLDFDASRTLKNGFVGMCFGPAVHEYYEFSDWILPVDGLTFGITNRAFKILMDQTIYLSVKCSIYILAVGVLNGDSVAEGAENVKNRIKPIMFTAWKFWPLVHCVTYGLIPARHRILWVNSVDLVWNAILATKARDDDDENQSNDEISKIETSIKSDNDSQGKHRLEEFFSSLLTPSNSDDSSYPVKSGASSHGSDKRNS